MNRFGKTALRPDALDNDQARDYYYLNAGEYSFLARWYIIMAVLTGKLIEFREFPDYNTLTDPQVKEL